MVEALVRHELTTEESTWVVSFPNPRPILAPVETRLTRRPEVLEKRPWDERRPVREGRVTVLLQDGRDARRSTINVNRVAPRPLMYASAITETQNDAIVEAATEGLLYNPVERKREATDLSINPVRSPRRGQVRKTEPIQA